MVKVLQILGGGSAIGGVEQMLLNYYSYMDRDKVQFDFCFSSKCTFTTIPKFQRDAIEKSQIYSLEAIHGNSSLWNYIKIVPKLMKIISNGRYDIVHVNAGRPALLLAGIIASYRSGVKVRILHSHSTKGKSGKSNLYDFAYSVFSLFSRFVFKSLATHFFACSTEAGKYMFGRNIINSPTYKMIRNAVNVHSYDFNVDVRNAVRREMNVSGNTKVYGHVGRFSKEKNQLFLLDVFKEIHNADKNSILWLIGDGNIDIKKSIVDKIKQLKLEDSVLLLGSRDDVNRLDQALDALIFPSTYEGLSVVLIEAQTSALPVFASSNITKEHKITDLVYFLDLKNGPKKWAAFILETMPKLPNRASVLNDITKNGYNIEHEAKLLQNFYLQHS